LQLCGICATSYCYSADLRRHLKVAHNLLLPGLTNLLKKNRGEVYIFPELGSCDITDAIKAKLTQLSLEEENKYEKAMSSGSLDHVYYSKLNQADNNADTINDTVEETLNVTTDTNLPENLIYQQDSHKKFITPLAKAVTNSNQVTSSLYTTLFNPNTNNVVDTILPNGFVSIAPQMKITPPIYQINNLPIATFPNPQMQSDNASQVEFNYQTVPTVGVQHLPSCMMQHNITQVINSNLPLLQAPNQQSQPNVLQCQNNIVAVQSNIFPQNTELHSSQSLRPMNIVQFPLNNPLQTQQSLKMINLGISQNNSEEHCLDSNNESDKIQVQNCYENASNDDVLQSNNLLTHTPVNPETSQLRTTVLSMHDAPELNTDGSNQDGQFYNQTDSSSILFMEPMNNISHAVSMVPVLSYQCSLCHLTFLTNQQCLDHIVTEHAVQQTDFVIPANDNIMYQSETSFGANVSEIVDNNEAVCSEYSHLSKKKEELNAPKEKSMNEDVDNTGDTCTGRNLRKNRKKSYKLLSMNVTKLERLKENISEKDVKLIPNKKKGNHKLVVICNSSE